MSKNKNKRHKEKKEKKEVYILLTKTRTVPSRVIHFFKRMPYVHVSIALDENLHELYSFARKTVHNPFNCGFIDEDINSGILYRDIEKAIEIFKADREKYKYNYLGVLSIYFHLGFERKYKYFCSQFVDKVLQMGGVDLFDKKPSKVIPDDFRNCDKLEKTFEGKLQSYRDFVNESVI